MLKWIALILMIIDHFGYVFKDFIPENYYIILRSIGRLCFPIFVYYTVLGLNRTSNLKKYLGRLLIFAIIAEIAIRYSGYFERDYLNVIFSFFLYGLLFVVFEQKIKMKNESLRDILSFSLLLILIVAIPHVEYNFTGFIIFVGLYIINKLKVSPNDSRFKLKLTPSKLRMYSVLIITGAFGLEILFNNGLLISLFAGIAGLLLFRENLDKRAFPKLIEKWTFYVFYPAQWVVYALCLSYLFNK